MRTFLRWAIAATVFGWLAACAPAPTPTALPPTAAPPTLAPTIVRPTAVPATAAIAPTATTAATATTAPTATRAATPTVAGTDVPRPHAAMTHFEVNKAKNPNAICNDGSTAVFFFQRGYGNGANKWIVFFEGGGACWDGASCSTRDKPLLTSTVWANRQVDGDGILSDRPDQNPDFYSWNHVFVPYCSSDWWSGMRADNSNEVHFYFRGHYIVDAVVDSIMDSAILGSPTLREATQVIFSGSSAGGIGMRINLDRLAKEIAWADVRGVQDALMVLVGNPAFVPEEEKIENTMIDLYKPGLDESCAAASSAHPGNCLMTDYANRNKQISTPLFVRQDLYDPINLDWQHLDNKNSSDRQYIQAIATQTNDLLRSFPAAFGTATSDHIALQTTKFNTDKVDGFTFAQVLGNWYFNRSGPKVVVAPLRR